MYSGRVFVGFWFDKLQLDLEKHEEYERKRANGELPEQRLQRLICAFTCHPPPPSPLPSHRASNYLLYGQPIQLHCPEILDLSNSIERSLQCPEDLHDPPAPTRYGLVLAATASFDDVHARVTGIENGCPLACTTRKDKPEARSVFVFRSAEGCEKRERERDGESVGYGEDVYLQLLHGKDTLYLRSETPLLDGQFGPRDHNPVRLSVTRDCYAKWRPVHWDRHRRFETEGAPIKPCARMVMQHVMTGQCLAAESLIWHRSLLGFECGVSAHNYRDVHRCEKSECIWNAIVANS